VHNARESNHMGCDAYMQLINNNCGVHNATGEFQPKTPPGLSRAIFDCKTTNTMFSSATSPAQCGITSSFSTYEREQVCTEILDYQEKNHMKCYNTKGPDPLNKPAR
jgi:hypothetical protein